MVEEFELLEEAEVQFEDSDCAESVWHGVGYCESLFCRKKPAAELTLVIRKEGILYFLCADLPEFQELCRLHGWYVVSHHPFSDTLEIGMCIMEAGRHAGWYSLGHSSERNAVYRELLEYTFERSERQDFYPYETSFKGQCVIDGCTCHYLHDYHPTWMEKKDEHQKRVSNLIFRFKEGGHCGELVAQILAFALLHAGFEKGHGADTRPRLDAREAAEAFSGSLLLPVEGTRHRGRLQGDMDSRRPGTTERPGEERRRDTLEPAIHAAVHPGEAYRAAG